MKVVLKFFKGKDFGLLSFLFLILTAIFTLIAMCFISIKEELNSAGLIYEISEYYLNFLNNIGASISMIDEGNVINYLISHLIIAFLIATIVRIILLKRQM